MSLSPRPTAVAAAALAGALVLALAACSPGTADAASVAADGTTTIRYDGSAGQVTLPELADDLGYFEKVRLEWVGNSTGGPQSIQSAATGATDVGGAFNGAIVKLRSSGAEVTSVISYYGSDAKAFGGFYTLADSPVTRARDLIGKKIGINTLGAQSEFVIREWLAREGLDADEIAQVELTVVPPVNAEQVLREGQVDVVAISSVFQDRALERGGLHLLFSEVELFGEFSYGSYIFRDDFIEENPEAVADYVQGIARAIRWTQVTPVDEVRARYTQIITDRDRGETPELVPYWKSVGVSTPGGVIEEREISTWIDWLVRNGELEKGRFSADDVYTNEYNPYANGTYEPGSGPDGEPVDAS
jgi:ABC-type nitrate/sulfonate/bicarbonate transport system substrate-binding protein